MNQEL